MRRLRQSFAVSVVEHGVDQREIDGAARRVAAVVLCWMSLAAGADGFVAELGYTADAVGNVEGGVETGWRYLDNLDVAVGVDADAAWDGVGYAFAHLIYNNDTEFSRELVGDLQVVDNIDAPGGTRLLEAWYQAPLLREATTLRVGVYDLNSEFDVLLGNRSFLHSSQGIGADIAQTGANGPSIFPFTSLGARLQHAAEFWAVRAVVLDAVPGDSGNVLRPQLGASDGALVVVEAEALIRSNLRAYGGLWAYSSAFEMPFEGDNPDVSRGNDGWYLATEMSGAVVEAAGDRRWWAFLRYGRADPRFNAFASYLGFGARCSLPLSGRPRDTIGFAVAMARTGTAYRDYQRTLGAPPANAEQAYELTYSAPLSRWLAAKLSIQHVRRPSGLADRDDAWIVGVRLAAIVSREF